MSEWGNTTLGEIATLIKRGRAPHYTDFGTLVVSQKCVREGNVFAPELARRTDETLKPIPDWAFLRAGDVLVNSTGHGTLGRASVVRVLSEPATADSHVSIVRVDDTLALPDFVGTVLSHARADLESLATGTTKQTELSTSALSSFPMVLPPLAEQFRIVAVMGSIDEQMEALQGEAESLVVLLRVSRDSFFERLFEGGCTTLLSEAIVEEKRPVRVDPDEQYAQIGVRSFGRGVFTKEPVSGAVIGKKRIFWVEPGDLVVNIVFGWEGAVAVIPDYLENHCGSHRFPTYRRTDDGPIDYVRQFLLSSRGLQILGLASPGGAGRNRTLNRARLGTFQIPWPELAVQRDISDALGALESRVNVCADELASLRRVRSDLFRALLSQQISVDEAVDQFIEPAA